MLGIVTIKDFQDVSCIVMACTHHIGTISGKKAGVDSHQLFVARLAKLGSLKDRAQMKVPVSPPLHHYYKVILKHIKGIAMKDRSQINS